MIRINPTKVLVDGDEAKARTFIGQAKSQLELLRNQMSFQKLSQGVRKVWLNPDVFVECRLSFNYQECTIWARPESSDELNPEFLQLRVTSPSEDWTIIWDFNTNTPMKGVTDNDGEPVTFPVETDNISTWLEEFPESDISPVFTNNNQYTNLSYSIYVYDDSFCLNWGDPCIAGTYSGCADVRDDPANPYPFTRTCECSGTTTTTSNYYLWTDTDGSTELPRTSYHYIDRGCIAYWRNHLRPGPEDKQSLYAMGYERPDAAIYRVESQTSLGGERGLIKGIDEASEMPYNSTTTFTRDIVFRSPFAGQADIEHSWSAESPAYSNVVGDLLFIASGMSTRNLFYIALQQERYASTFSGATTGYFNTVDSVVSVHMEATSPDLEPSTSIDPFATPEHKTLTELVQNLVSTVKQESTDSRLDSVDVYGTLFELPEEVV